MKPSERTRDEILLILMRGVIPGPRCRLVNLGILARAYGVSLEYVQHLKHHADRACFGGGSRNMVERLNIEALERMKQKAPAATGA